MNTGTFTHDGIVFHYNYIGEGKKHVVLQHGFSDCADSWGIMPTDLSKNGYKVFMMDARGHGRSGKPDQGYNLTTLTKDMIAFTQYLKLDRPVIIGHSMGGSMGARALASYTDLFRAGVFIDPAFRETSQENAQKTCDKRRNELGNLKKLSHKQIIEYTRGKHPGWSDVDIESYAMSKIFLSICIVDIIFTIDKGWKEDLNNITCQTLLITADVDKGAIVLPDTANFIRKNYSNFEFLYVPKVGHSIHRENYPVTLEALLKFLSTKF
jgi:N-formylmaleamate deformylase